MTQKSPKPIDLIADFEDILESVDRIDLVERGDEETVVSELPISWLRDLVEMAKRAPKEGRGRKPLSRSDKQHDLRTIIAARKRKHQLLFDAKAAGERLTAQEAAWQAAAKTKAKMGSRLSVSEIEDRIYRRQSRRKQ